MELGRLKIDRPVATWIDQALAADGVALVHLTPEIVVESTQLPQPFHRDPADQLIVATARVLDCALFTQDSKILSYGGVRISS